MTGSTDTAAGATAIRSFTVPIIPEAELDDLRARITATRWPDSELVADHSQGVQLAMIQELARYWATEYDWRRSRRCPATGTPANRETPGGDPTGWLAPGPS
jgi:hypothetical protein